MLYVTLRHILTYIKFIKIILYTLYRRVGYSVCAITRFGSGMERSPNIGSVRVAYSRFVYYAGAALSI